MPARRHRHRRRPVPWVETLEVRSLLAAAYTVTDLGTLGGDMSNARDINDAGQVVGAAEIRPNVDHAFLYSGGKMMDLGTLGGSASFANGVNDAGQVVGYADTGNASHAFLYSGGKMTDLGTLGGS